MKSRIKTIAIFAAALFVLLAHAEIPSAAQKEIDQLVQQDKFTEALAKVEALLKASPADKDLLDLKAQLEKSKPVSAPASVAPATPKLKGEDRLLLDTLNSIIDDIKAAPDADNRKKLMQEFLDKSKPFVEKFPDQTNIWVMRAAAAIEVNDLDCGWQAGQKLKAMGALDSDDVQTRKVMASLNRKGWLNENTIKDEMASIAQRKWWNGRWTATQETRVPNYPLRRVSKAEFNISRNENANPEVEIQFDEDTFLLDDGALNGARHYKIPGQYSYSASNFALSGKTRIVSTALNSEGSQLTVKIEIQSDRGGEPAEWIVILTRELNHAKVVFSTAAGEEILPTTALNRSPR